MSDLELRLNLLADYFQYWRDWNMKTRDAEGLPTYSDTSIICVPPHWPSHGSISHWIETIRQAEAVIRTAKQ